MAGKFYAVKVGRKCGIYGSWDEAKEQVNGFAGAVYKSFKTQDDAELFMRGEQTVQEQVKTVKQEAVVPDYDCAIYVKGTVANGIVSSGVYVESTGVKYGFGFTFDKFKESGTVSSELLAVLAGVETAIDTGFNDIAICYSFQGCESWYNGVWTPHDELPLRYVSVLKKLVYENSLTLHFVKKDSKFAKAMSKKTYSMLDKISSELILSGGLRVANITVNTF